MSRRLDTPARCHSSNRTVPVTVGFASCKYRFSGFKAIGEKYTSDWVVVDEDDCYQLFKSDAQTVWGRLIVETAKLYDNSLLTAVTKGDYSFGTFSTSLKRA